MGMDQHTVGGGAGSPKDGGDGGVTDGNGIEDLGVDMTVDLDQGPCATSAEYAAEAALENCTVRAMWAATAAFYEGATIDDNPFDRDAQPRLWAAWRNHFDNAARLSRAQYGGLHRRKDLWG